MKIFLHPAWFFPVVFAYFFRYAIVLRLKMMYYLMLVLCGPPGLLVLSLFVVHLGRMGIYFDVSQRNGTPYLCSPSQNSILIS